MAKEYIDYGYTGAISVTSEVKNVKDTFLPLGGINLTLRQTVLIAVGGTLAFLVTKLGTALHLDFLATLLAVLVAAPCIATAFITIHGLPIDDYLMVWWSNCILSNAIRRNDSLNTFESLEQAGRRPEKKKKKEKGKAKSIKKQPSVHVLHH